MSSLNAPIAVDDLGPLQVEILKIVWRLGDSSVQAICDAFGPEYQPHYITILTVLRRLERRGFVTHTREGRRFIYRATVGQELLQHSLVADMRNRFFATSEEFRQTVDRVLTTP